MLSNSVKSYSKYYKDKLYWLKSTLNKNTVLFIL